MSNLYSTAVLALNPVAYYRMGESTGQPQDSSGNAQHTTALGGSPTYGQTGAITGDPGKAILLDGSTEYFTAPDSALLDVTSTFTLLAWIKKAADGSYMTIVDKGASGFHFRTSDTNKLELVKSGVAILATSTPTITGTSYHFVAAVKTPGATPALYIDGAAVALDSSVTTDTENTAVALQLGRHNSGVQYWNGTLQHLVILPIALSAADILNLYTIALAATGTSSVDTYIVWREPTPPHAAIYVTRSAGVAYEQRVRGMGTASVLVPRSDPNAAGIARLLNNSVPLVTIERSDGLLPFVGWPVNPLGRESDTSLSVTLNDHTVRLNQAKTRIVSEKKVASGTLIVNELRAMEERAAPPLYIDVRHVAQGRPASLALNAIAGDSFLRELELQTGYDAFFTYDIDMHHVTTYLQWRAMQGTDRTGEDSWRGGDQLNDVAYGIDNRLGAKSATTVGGIGIVTARPLASHSLANKQGFGGSRAEFIQALTDKQVLAERSKQVLRSPRNAPATWEFGLVESRVDMTRVGVGDIRVIGSDTAFLGQPVEGIVRIISMQMNPATGVHSCVGVGV